MILTAFIHICDCSINLLFQLTFQGWEVKIMDFKLNFNLVVKDLSFRLLMIFVLILIKIMV